MNGPTKTVGPPWTPLPARKSKGVLEKVLDDADAVIDGNWLSIGRRLPNDRPRIRSAAVPNHSQQIAESLAVLLYGSLR